MRKITQNYPRPLIDQVTSEFGHDPFLILISCLLSLRSRDVVTTLVCKELFQIAQTPADFSKFSLVELESIIFRTGFYKNKAKVLVNVSREILKKYCGEVPQREEELLALPGIGRKTANLVLGKAFGVPAICVDTHVHRLSNLWGIVQTSTPYETERSLTNILPKKYWIEWNNLLVIYGQNILRSNSNFGLQDDVSLFLQSIT